MIFYTSDLHLGNANIIEYENRPWKTVEGMDAELIANWNSRVRPNDEVYVLGDFTLRRASEAIKYLECLNGRIHLLRGNHDFFYSQKSFELWKWNSDKGDNVYLEGPYKHLSDDGREIILCHFPILYWDGMDDRGSYHLYGHMHSRPNMQHPHKDAFNVGVDVNNYYPVTLDELVKRVK